MQKEIEIKFSPCEQIKVENISIDLSSESPWFDKRCERNNINSVILLVLILFVLNNCCICCNN
ncbi:hypothetical protein ABG79_01026 [Caloramator mitchellensis]|uniref:Uncharacterized protein n=1 Tax=Caloramator mitchellensis TaxID=908809 RepID=A0A0R3JUH5_CALMK|nr:hypothetical protein [Caloramator mitchellensis]KRQ87223.1 hypothetical protein ABG79_01026 [Caloramator mitchellensis]